MQAFDFLPATCPVCGGRAVKVREYRISPYTENKLEAYCKSEPEHWSMTLYPVTMHFERVPVAGRRGEEE